MDKAIIRSKVEDIISKIDDAIDSINSYADYIKKERELIYNFLSDLEGVLEEIDEE